MKAHAATPAGDHATAADALAAWDAGEQVWTVAMGGLGPGYEQAIQLLMFEIVRDELGKPVPTPETPMNSWADATVARVDPWPGCGFSGAQIEAAKWLAYRFLRDGPRATVNKDRARGILVSRTWPRDPAPFTSR